MRALFRKKKRVFLLWVFCSKRELLSTQKLLSFSVFQRKRKENNNNNNTTDSLLHIKRFIAFSVSVGIILYIHTSSIERREKEGLAKEKASSSSRSDFEEEEE